MRAAAIAAILAVCVSAGAAGAADLPNPVKTCADVRAYIGPDGTMPMQTFKQLLIAGGMAWDEQKEETLNNHCKVTAYVANVIMIQHVTDTIVVKSRVVDDGVCKLTDIALSGC